MAPGVPFALLAGVQLLSVAAALGLAGAACFPRLRTRATPVLVIGAVLLAVTDAITAVDYGPGTSDRLGYLRAAATLLLAVGFVSGGLRMPRPPSLAEPAIGGAAIGAVVVPLGASMRPTVAATVAAGLASVAVLRHRRADPPTAWLLVGAFAALAVAAVLGDEARTSYAAAVGVLAARGAWAVCIFAVFVRFARTSVLAKVVGAILFGVLAMAIGAVAVGSVVAGVVSHQQANQARSVVRNQAGTIGALPDNAGTFATIVAVGCPGQPTRCSQLLGLFGALNAPFAAEVTAHGRVKEFSTPGRGLTPTAKLQLKTLNIVRAVLSGSPQNRSAEGSLAILDGNLVAVGVAPIHAPGAPPDAPPIAAAIYGSRIDDQYAAQQQQATTYDLTVIVDGVPRASSLSRHDARVVAREARRAGATTGRLAAQGSVLTRMAHGDQPAAAFDALTATDGEPLGVLAASQDAHIALAAQKRAFTELFLIALGVMVSIALAALVIGHRVVDPVRRLTVVAARVRRGDLTATAGFTGRDEVGTLARTFDAMTASVAGLTDDLRAAAAEEAALRARLETVLASMSDGVIATDADGVVTSINRTAAELAQVTADDVVGRPIGEVIDVRDRDGAVVRLDRPRRASLEGTLLRGEAAGVPVQVDVAALQGDDGVTGVVVVLRDQTRDREVERLKTEFLSNVSHELRTPLTPIRGYAEIIRRKPDLPRQQTEGYVDTILESTARMSRVVDLLVDVAAIEAGRVRPNVTTVPVGSYVDERVEQWRARYPARAEDFRRRVARGLPVVAIDREWIAKALDELVDNAVKYTPAGTSIALAASAGDDGWVRLSVRDAGQGIDPETMPTLLGDFVQADGSETRRVGGLGLGLSFVRRLVGAFGLGFDVATSPGRGAEFTIVVPVAASPDVAPRRRPRAARAGARRPAARASRPTSARRRRPPAEPPDS